MKKHKLYSFGGFQLDAEMRRLWHGEELVPLTPKEFEVLSFLIEREGKVVEKNELLDTVWADAFVEEATLARNISWLRKKLRKFSQDEKFIETVPKRGYRFIAEVERFGQDESYLVVEEQTIKQLTVEETITQTEENFVQNKPKSIALSEAKLFKHNKYLQYGIFVLGLILFAGTGFTLYQNHKNKGKTKAIVAKRIVALSGETGFEDSPRFSPDGQRIVYTWNRGKEKNGDIYVRLVKVGDPLQLTKSELNDRYPTFSPDGTQIAFVRDYNKFAELITVPSLGGSERVIRRLFSADYSLSYSPDGKHIAVIDRKKPDVKGQYAIYLVNTETFERKRLTAEGRFNGETTPRFSPDGANVAFIRLLEKGMDLFTVSSSGGEPKRLTFDNATIHSLAWDADGEYIYFVSKREGNKARLWRIPAEGGESEIVSVEGGGLVNLAFSPDGQTLAYSQKKIIGSIYRVKPDGQAPQKIISSNSTNFVSDYSPDGASILFLSDRIRPLDLWKANSEGKDILRLTDSMINIGQASFSKDGKQIGFHGTNREGQLGAFVVSSQGGEVRQIKADGHLISPITFGAGGKWIYFYSNKTGENQIWKLWADGSGEPVQITRKGGVFPVTTADGQMIYYKKSISGDIIWRVPVNGGKEEKVDKIHDAGFNTAFWDLTERGIFFFVRNPDKSYQVKFYDFANDRVSDADGDYQIPPDIGGRIATDGKDFIYADSKTTSNIMLADISE